MNEAIKPQSAAHALPLYQRIRIEIEQNILSGVWPPGHRIPSEHALMEAYGCSRMTLNKVLSGLAAIGLIERKRRAGSVVAQPRAQQSAVLQIPDLKAEIEARGARYGYRLLSLEKRQASAEDRRRLGVTGRCAVLSLRCLHLIAARPFAYEERLINLREAPEALDQDFSTVPPNTWLLGHVPWSTAEHRIGAINADADLAATLRVEIGTACLTIERRTWGRSNWSKSEPITAVRLAHPGALYDLFARFRPTA